MSEHETIGFELEEYETARGQRPHARWLSSLDAIVRARVTLCLRRLESGNTSNVKPLGGGISELRLNFGPGYRIYFARVGPSILLLLAGGNKQRQSDDIANARTFWNDFQTRSKKDAAQPEL